MGDCIKNLQFVKVTTMSLLLHGILMFSPSISIITRIAHIFSPPSSSFPSFRGMNAPSHSFPAAHSPGRLNFL